MATIPEISLAPEFQLEAMLLALGCTEQRCKAIITQQKEERRALEFFALYERPRDYPNSYVVRRWEFRAVDIWATPDRDAPCVIASSLAVARTCLGCVRPGCQLSRFELNESNETDPVIKEVWF